MPLAPLGNPFWSERAQGDFRLAQARPSELPDVAVEPIRDGAGARRRDGSRPRGRVGAPSDESYGTPMMTSLRPPSSWIRVENPMNSGTQHGRQSEGLLPPSTTSSGWSGSMH